MKKFLSACAIAVALPFSSAHAHRLHRYRTALTVTGYSWGCGATGYTASGQYPYVGGAAAYHPQFPFGTRISIPGLWTIRVNDSGGAVGWGHVDVFFPSCYRALQWGRRVVWAVVYR